MLVDFTIGSVVLLGTSIDGSEDVEHAAMPLTLCVKFKGGLVFLKMCCTSLYLEEHQKFLCTYHHVCLICKQLKIDGW